MSMLDNKTIKKCTDEIIEILDKYTQNVTEAKTILNQISIDQYSKIFIKDIHWIFFNIACAANLIALASVDSSLVCLVSGRFSVIQWKSSIFNFSGKVSEYKWFLLSRYWIVAVNSSL